MTPRLLRLPVVCVLLLGCPSTVTIGADEDGFIPEPTADAGPAPGTDSGPVDLPPEPMPPVVEPPPGVVACGGIECASGQECCLATLECFDPSDTASCSSGDGLDSGECASNRDCGPMERCARVEGSVVGGCGGLGQCRPRPSIADCGLDSPACGCDGRTYESACAARVAGVRVAWPWACGGSSMTGTQECESELDCNELYRCDFERGICVANDPIIACTLDAHCEAGQRCCPHSGLCVSDGDAESCFAAPEGTLLPCRTDLDCLPLEIDGVTGGESEVRVRSHYCDHPRCDELGGCRLLPGGCSGELEPVCGCDGASYSNSCWAADARVSVAAEGECG